MKKKSKSVSSAKKKEAKVSSKKSGKKTHASAAIIIICSIVLVIGAAIVLGCFYFAGNDPDRPILQNVTVAGVDVGGMTQAQAIEAVKAATDSTYSRTPMTVKVLDSEITIPAEACGTLNVKKAVRDAYRYGYTGFESRREKEHQIAATTGYAVDITPYLSLDNAAIQEKLDELGGIYNTTLTQSTYEVNGTAPEQTLVITLGVPEYGLNMDSLYDSVMDAFNQNVFSVEGSCEMMEPDPVDLAAIHKEYYIAPEEPCFDEDTFEVIDGKDGYGFDLEDAQQKLTETPYGSTLEIPLISISPTTTKEELAAMLYRDVLGTCTGTAYGSSSRNNNLNVACQAINGLILYPGDVFSFNDVVGERTPEAGYMPAPTYVGNKTVNTYGGGVCQVSSIIYNCALQSDFEILLREYHTYATTYVQLGTDAVINWGTLDFRFRNTSEYPIRIDAVADGGTVTVSFVGTETRDYYVKMEHEVLATYYYDVEYEEMTADNEKGYKDGEYITTPYTGYDVNTYRCKYSRETDELISREFEDSSHYSSRNAVICKIIEETTEPTTTEASKQEGIGNGNVSDDSGALPDTP